MAGLVREAQVVRHSQHQLMVVAVVVVAVLAVLAGAE
jgi:hypothetical protein